jgi:hypothetical protein
MVEPLARERAMYSFYLHRTKCRVVTLKVQKLVGGMQKGSKKQTVFLYFSSFY